MIVEAGILSSIEIERLRVQRYRRRLQALSHRAPRYRLRYQIVHNQSREVEIREPMRPHLIADIRRSQPGDTVEVRLSDDGVRLYEWNNITALRLLDQMGRTWGESD